MSYKFQQVLRTKVPLTVNGLKVAPGTRVVVMKADVGSSRIRVRIDDPNHPELTNSKFEASVGAFTLTHRGRPTKEKSAV